MSVKKRIANRMETLEVLRAGEATPTHGEQVTILQPHPLAVGGLTRDEQRRRRNVRKRERRGAR